MGISRFCTPRSRYCLISTVSFDRRPDQGGDRVAVDGLQLGQDGFEPVGAVLGVDQEPVQAGPGAESAMSGLPEHTHIPASGRPASPGCESVERKVPHSKRHVMLPSGP